MGAPTNNQARLGFPRSAARRVPNRAEATRTSGCWMDPDRPFTFDGVGSLSILVAGRGPDRVRLDWKGTRNFMETVQRRQRRSCCWNRAEQRGPALVGGRRFSPVSKPHPQTNWDLWVLPLDSDNKPRVFLRTPFMNAGRFSPDGRWSPCPTSPGGFRSTCGRWSLRLSARKRNGGRAGRMAGVHGRRDPSGGGPTGGLYHTSGGWLLAAPIAARRARRGPPRWRCAHADQRWRGKCGAGNMTSRDGRFDQHGSGGGRVSHHFSGWKLPARALDGGETNMEADRWRRSPSCSTPRYSGLRRKAAFVPGRAATVGRCSGSGRCSRRTARPGSSEYSGDRRRCEVDDNR